MVLKDLLFAYDSAYEPAGQWNVISLSQKSNASQFGKITKVGLIVISARLEDKYTSVFHIIGLYGN